ncbi:Hypothetical predicted protein [Olea europaea subsp. europaea]|uniref:Uncharacterized protein n=1 Tax=Olea europaea subsp. europaea TaxID=158383 RepID=A0A8S0PWU1_OLEEU|nr:Hypothetical predicted protein [Olea europaea subsp. europaea]
MKMRGIASQTTKGNGRRNNETGEGTEDSMRHQEAGRSKNGNQRSKMSGFGCDNPFDWVLREEETALPFFNGFMVEMSIGSIIPASWVRMSRCPDELVTACYDDPNWEVKLLQTYDTQADQFVIARCTWNTCQLYIAMVTKGTTHVTKKG